MTEDKLRHDICRIGLFMIWLILLTPIYTADALEIQFNPDTNVTVTDLSASINWRTDEDSSGVVFYGVNPEAMERVPATGSSRNHSVTLTGIAHDTLFKFYIEASNSTGDKVRSPVDGGDFHTFRTEPRRDREPPKAVKDLAALRITQRDITIVWEKDSRDTDVDHYIVFMDGIILDDDVKTKSYTASGLNFSTEFEFKVSAVDTSGNKGPNTTLRVTTRSEDYQELAISNFNAEVIGNTIDMTWSTNVESHTRVRYSTNPLLLDQKKEDPVLTTTHNMTLTGLEEGVSYTVMAESCDVSGNCGNSSPVSLNTSEQIALDLSVDGYDCDPQTMSFSRSERLDVKGTAAPGSDVIVYVDGIKERFKRITATGEFSFLGIDVDASVTVHDIRVTASDRSSPDKECIDRVQLDFMPPEVHFSNETENLAFALEQNVQISGNVTDENKVTLYVYLASVDDVTPPPAPTNLSNSSLAADSIGLSWAPFGAEVTDVFKYYIYRSDVPGGPIAFTEPTVTTFTDVNVSSETTYTYQVSAVDDAGNEGDRSPLFSVTTLEGENVAEPMSSIVPPNPSLLLTKDYTTANSTIDFTESVGPLFEGQNNLRLVFTDIAGNEREELLEIRYDSEPPTIISPTAAELGMYSPTYMSEILIRGQMNKPTGEVWVWVNPTTTSFSINSLTAPSSVEGSFSTTYPEEPDQKFSVQENGTFELEIELGSSMAASISGSFTGDTGAGSTSASSAVSVTGPSTSGAADNNHVVIIAFDEYGRPSQPIEGDIQYTPCGEAYYWSVELNQGGNVINTRELLEGVAAYGFGYDLEWVGGGNAALARAQNVRVVRATVGEREAEKYDFDWLAGDPRVLTRRGNATSGFVMINFAPQDPEGETYLEKEQNLSAHRRGECWPDVGGHGPGCIQLLLEMQIDSDPGPFRADYAASAAGVAPPGTQAIQTQKQCLLMQVMLDERIDFASSDFVKGLLNVSLRVINKTLEFIEMIETPIKYAAQITLGICLLTYVSKFIVDALASYKCKWNAVLRQAGAGDNLIGSAAAMVREARTGSVAKVAGMHNERDVQQGACNVEFPPEGAEGATDQSKAFNEACKDCAEWKGKSRWITDKWHLFCDRVMCPSVPSLQYYIQQAYGRSGRPSLFRSTAGAAAGAASSALSSGDIPTSTCPVFDSNTRNTKVADCNCSNTRCPPANADSSANYICKDNACTPVTTPCPSGETSSDCKCGNKVCVATQTCEAGANCRGRSVTGAGSPTPAAITDINSESSYLPTPSSSEPSTPLITGFDVTATAGAPPPGQPAAPATPAAGGSAAASGGCQQRTGGNTGSAPAAQTATTAKDPKYGTIQPYSEKGLWNKAPYAKATSDCEFVEQGREPIAKMWDAYNKATEQEKNMCKGGHLPQPMCCPFEYMNEWGWGMLYSNEVKMSHCLANPEDDACGIGQTIQRGVTGICQPKGSRPRATPIVLDDLKFKTSDDYPADRDTVYNRDVVYMVDIDESGTATSVQLGYLSKAGVGNVIGGVESTGRVEISGRYEFVPLSENNDISREFPARDASDVGNDQEGCENPAQAAVRKNLQDIAQHLERKSEPRSTGVLTRTINNEDPVEHWFRQIFGLMGEPGRQYLAQPAGSFMQSILTLCLSGILSWLIQFKNMLILLQQCFQTILVTGDGSSGQCQALISQYICDLIKEAISCITTRLGGGGNARVGIGGVSGFFASISDASRGMTEAAQSRYGDRNLFGSVFSAENVLHDACIFMFTGEWPTDFGALFENAATLPINSSGLVFPVTRRWQAYDPSTGYSRYVYRIAYSFFAGADVHFDVKLGCSGQGMMCDTETGICDCGHDNLARYQSQGRVVEMNIPRHGSGDCPETGDLSQGQFCSDEILFVAEGNPLRYDSVIVSYMPTRTMGGGGQGSATGAMGAGFGGTMADASAVTGRIVGTIREIGGPPIGLCSFDIGMLAFRCGVEVPPTGFARFISVDLVNAPAPPQYGAQQNSQYGNAGMGVQYGQQTYATSSFGSQYGAGGGTNYGSSTTGSGTAYSAGYSNTPVNLIPYGLGDSVIARARVQQELPPQAASCSGDCEFTKYLVISEIKNQNGVKVYPTAPRPVGERLNRPGVNEYTVFDANDFPAHASASRNFVITEDMFSVRGGNSVRPYTRLGNLTRYITGQIQAVNAVPPLMVNISIRGTQYSYVTGAVNPATNQFESSGGSAACETPPTDNTLRQGDNPEIVCGGFRFRLDASRLMRAPVAATTIPDGDIVIDFPSSQASGGAELCPENPVPWTMVLELRDSVSIGGAGYEMALGPSVDFETGQIQQRPLTFSVVCRQGSGSNPATASIEQLVRRSATVRPGHSASNSTFGLWADADSLGPSESITVSDFEWVAPEDHGRGFRINIDSNAEYGVLNINVGALGLVPTSSILIEKAGRPDALRSCGEAPCIMSTGDANNAVIRIRLSSGDPVFSFTGFRASSALEQMPPGGVILDRTHLVYPTSGLPSFRLLNPIPSEPGARLILDNLMQNADGFSINYRTEPATLVTPGFTFSLDLNNMGYVSSGAPVQVQGVPACTSAASAQPAAAASGQPAGGSAGSGGSGGGGSSGDAACRAYGDRTWRCTCPTSAWTAAQCDASSSCVRSKCSGSFNNKYCCAPGTLAPGATPASGPSCATGRDLTSSDNGCACGSTNFGSPVAGSNLRCVDGQIIRRCPYDGSSPTTDCYCGNEIIYSLLTTAICNSGIVGYSTDPVADSGTGAACNDGFDNDGDGYIDENDPGCYSNMDDDETDDVDEDYTYGYDECAEGDYQCIGAAFAVADVNSESASLPTPQANEPSIPGITGFVPAATLTLGGAQCSKHTITGQKYPGAETIYLYDCPPAGSAGNKWVSESGAPLSCTIIKVNNKWYYTNREGGAQGPNTGYAAQTEATLAMGASSVCGTGGTGGPGGSSVAGAGDAVAGGFPSGATSCYSVTGNVVNVKTLGSATGTSLSVSGVSRRTDTSVASIAEAPGNQLTLTAARPEQYGVGAVGLSSGARVTISNIVANSGSTGISMNVAISGQGMPAQTPPVTPQPVQLMIELLPLNVRTGSSTAVHVAGRAEPLPVCSTTPAAPCVSLLGGDRIAVLLLPDMSGTLSISNLVSASPDSLACADKLPDAPCQVAGVPGTCWEPNIAGVGLQCFSECRKNYVIAHMGENIRPESGFCLPTSRSTCNGADFISSGCGDGKRCCPNGQGRTTAPAGGGGGGGGDAAAAPGASDMSQTSWESQLPEVRALGQSCGPAGYRPFIECSISSQCTSSMDYPNLAPGAPDNNCAEGLACCHSSSSPTPLPVDAQCAPAGYCRHSCDQNDRLSATGNRACADYTICCAVAGYNPLNPQSIPDYACNQLHHPDSCREQTGCTWTWDSESGCRYATMPGCLNHLGTDASDQGRCSG